MNPIERKALARDFGVDKVNYFFPLKAHLFTCPPSVLVNRVPDLSIRQFDLLG
jgi:hypothetical protein